MHSSGKRVELLPSRGATNSAIKLLVSWVRDASARRDLESMRPTPGEELGARRILRGAGFSPGTTRMTRLPRLAFRWIGDVAQKCVLSAAVWCAAQRRPAKKPPPPSSSARARAGECEEEEEGEFDIA